MRLWETRNHKNAQYSKNERKYTNNLTKKKKKEKEPYSLQYLADGQFSIHLGSSFSLKEASRRQLRFEKRVLIRSNFWIV